MPAVDASALDSGQHRNDWLMRFERLPFANSRNLLLAAA